MYVTYWRSTSARTSAGSSGRRGEVEAALRAVRDDHRVLRHLRAHEAEDLGAVVHAVRPAEAAAGDLAAAQVDALDLGRVDVDLEQRRRLRHRRHLGRADLERERAPPAAVGVRPHRRLDEAELVAQDPVVVERGDRVEVLEDLLAQRGLRRLVALARRVEAPLEQLHLLLRDVRVRRDHVVLVALGEARAQALAVLAVGAQHGDLAPVQAGRDHEAVERVRLGLAAPDGRDAVGDPLAGLVEVERAVGRAEDAEVLQPRLPRPVDEARRALLDDPQPEVLEHRHRPRELELAADAVEADPGQLALVAQADVEAGCRR